PVTPGVAGSSPVRSANKKQKASRNAGFLLFYSHLPHFSKAQALSPPCSTAPTSGPTRQEKLPFIEKKVQIHSGCAKKS
ncbi:hypothetical protein, partial [Azospira sp. I13]|uniref:hypothetical protein n=1 Tax=Azospira sp. I13 TaxID=1765050 RepID=UPI001F31407F